MAFKGNESIHHLKDHLKAIFQEVNSFSFSTQSRNFDEDWTTQYTEAVKRLNLPSKDVDLLITAVKNWKFRRVMQKTGILSGSRAKTLLDQTEKGVVPDGSKKSLLQRSMDTQKSKRFHVKTQIDSSMEPKSKIHERFPGEGPLPKGQAMKYGNAMEPLAISFLRQNFDDVKRGNIQYSENKMEAAIPDAVLFEENRQTLVEIKCPSSVRNSDNPLQVFDRLTNANKRTFCMKPKDGTINEDEEFEWIGNVKSLAYWQIQMELFTAGANSSEDWAYLLVYSNNWEILIKVNYNLNVINRISVFEDYYFGQFIPDLMEGKLDHLVPPSNIRTCQYKNPESTDICGMQLDTITSYVKHVREFHGIQKPWKCHFCGQNFSQKCHLTFHLRVFHLKDKRHLCHICQQTFVDRWSLLRHYVTHLGVKIHECHLCGHFSGTKPALVLHMQSHLNSRLLGCHFCHQLFKQKPHLVQHLSKHLGQRQWTCHFCAATFQQRPHLQLHQLTHLKIRPDTKCHICGKTCLHKSNLRTHMKNHCPPSLVTCHICLSVKRGKTEFERHYAIHTGTKSFVCHFCSKSFTQKAHLRSHYKSHVK